jgi:hypothetical protein
MIFTDPVPFREALDAQAVKAVLPTELRSDLLSQLPAAIRERALFSAGVQNAELLDKLNRGIESILKGEKTETQVREELVNLDKFMSDKELSKNGRLDLVINTNVDMARGYGQWKQGQRAVILDVYPAQELFRSEDRNEPRDWPERWAAAGGGFFPGDSDYPEGRMIALKNDPIWTEISAFGLPYAPFDYNSGMDVQDIDRDEAESLGLIEPDDTIDPEDRGFNDDLQASPDVLSDALVSAMEIFLHGVARFGQDGVLRLIGGAL